MDRVIGDYQSGLSAVDVGKKHSIDPQTVLNNLKARGIKARPRPQTVITGDKLERAVDLRRQGWTYEAIGREFGLSRTAAFNALKETGRA